MSVVLTIDLLGIGLFDAINVFFFIINGSKNFAT